MADGGKPTFNARQRMDGLALLRSLPKRSASVVVFDPQYRAILDKQGYGNEAARQRARAELPPMADSTILAFVEEIERVLKPSGHLFLWMDKFSLWSAHWRRWLPEVTPLALVDGIAWEKPHYGLGRRFRCITEYLAVLQKGPRRAADVWTDHRIPDCWTHALEDAEQIKRRWTELSLKTELHAHAKPIGLTARLIESVTVKGDLVVDPAAGGYGVLSVCERTKRKFMGCDLL